MCSCIRSVREDHLVVYYNGKIMTKINDSYNQLKYGKYEGNRIFYKFNDEAEVQETYDDRIFNCTYKDETMQVRKSEDICRAINNDNLDDYAIVFKETYYEIHKIELITDLVKRSYGERVQLINDDTFVIDDRFMVDSKATAHYGTRGNDKSWKFLCIVVQGRPRKKAIKTKIGLVELDEMLLQILAKINYLLNPNINDSILTGQLPEWLLKTLTSEREAGV
tara:strand:+ start:2173 stop:2838 length:666 start_codon:yes stop_codon:yes gene_type:complete